LPDDQRQHFDQPCLARLLLGTHDGQVRGRRRRVDRPGVQDEKRDSCVRVRIRKHDIPCDELVDFCEQRARLWVAAHTVTAPSSASLTRARGLQSTSHFRTGHERTIRSPYSSRSPWTPARDHWPTACTMPSASHAWSATSGCCLPATRMTAGSACA